MSKSYLCIVRSPVDQICVMEDPSASPAEMEAMYAKFNEWKDKFQNKISDLGGKLGDGKVVTSDSSTDGPFMEVKEVVGGYMIVKADSIEEAIQVAQESPAVWNPHSTVEVREIRTL